MDFIHFAKNVGNAGMAGPEHLTLDIRFGI